jgi:drug/metabolite transporter (DMT)-like permease
MLDPKTAAEHCASIMDAVALALVSAFFVALGHVLAKFGLATLSPLRGAGVSVPTTTLALLLLSPFLIDWSHWNWKVLPIFAAVGCVFPAAVTLMNFESNRRVGPGLTAALSNLTPLFAVLGGIVLLGEVPRASQGVALLVILSGVALLLWRPERITQTHLLHAVAIALTAGALRGVVQPIIKLGQVSWPDPYAATTISYVVSATIILFIKAVTERGFRRPAPERGTFWFMAAGLSNGMSVLTLYAALARGPIALVAPLVACYPLFAIALSRAIGTVEVNARGVLGITMMIAGIVVLLAA